MSKKTWILISCLVLSLALGLGGSLAYLTDMDTKVNTFTMGNVDIKVDEVNGQEYVMSPGQKIDKLAKITNTGANGAWVWMTVAVPVEVDQFIELGWREGDENRLLPVAPDGMPMLEGEGRPYYVAKGEDDRYYHVYTQIWRPQLAPGASTEDLLLSVTLNEYVDIIDGEYYYVMNGEKTKIDYDLNGMQIIVTGYAIQTDGFEQGGVIEAYNAYRGQWGKVVVDNLATDPVEDKNEQVVEPEVGPDAEQPENDPVENDQTTDDTEDAGI